MIHDLRNHKLPAALGAKSIRGGSPRILLFARTGFSAALRDEAAQSERVELIDRSALVAGLQPVQD